MTRRTAVLAGLERALIAAALVSGGWALLHAARADFYRLLPVPTAAAHTDVLPGDGRGAADATNNARASLAPGAWVARLEAPTIRLSATVIEGSTDEMLARAAGHIEGTALPGERGNVGIAGHRDTTFRTVQQLRVGDPLRLTTQWGHYEYRVVRTFIVAPEDVQVLDPTEAPVLTLVTCYPFTFIGHAPKRYIIRAELIASSSR